MSMIPTAQVLCDILNDPTVPSEAKPAWVGIHSWVASGSMVLPGGGQPLEWGKNAAQVNSDLYWSLSAWLWERGVFPRVEVHGGGATCPWVKGMDFGLGSGRSPTEALAAVVRKVSQS